MFALPAATAMRGVPVPVISFDKSVVVAAVAGSKLHTVGGGREGVGKEGKHNTHTSIMPSSSAGRQGEADHKQYIKRCHKAQITIGDRR